MSTAPGFMEEGYMEEAHCGGKFIGQDHTLTVTHPTPSSEKPRVLLVAQVMTRLTWLVTCEHNHSVQPTFKASHC